MERRELEKAAVRSTYLRGLVAVPVGVLWIITGSGNLGWGRLDHPLLFTACVAALGLAVVGIHRYYNRHYGRVRLTPQQQRRYSLVSFLCLAIPMVVGSMLDFRLDLPVSVFAAMFGIGMLVWFATCTGLRPDHLLVWGGLVVIALLPVWGGFDDRASVGWMPIGIATIAVGVLDHRALVRAFGPPSQVGASG